MSLMSEMNSLRKSFSQVNTSENGVSQVCTHSGRVLFRLKCALTRRGRACQRPRGKRMWRGRISGRHRKCTPVEAKSWKLTQWWWPKLHAVQEKDVKKILKLSPEESTKNHLGIKTGSKDIWGMWVRSEIRLLLRWLLAFSNEFRCKFSGLPKKSATRFLFGSFTKIHQICYR